MESPNLEKVGRRRVGAPKNGARRVGPRRVGPQTVGSCKSGEGAQNSALFFFRLPPPFRSFFVSLDVFSWNFGGV